MTVHTPDGGLLFKSGEDGMYDLFQYLNEERHCLLSRCRDLVIVRERVEATFAKNEQSVITKRYRSSMEMHRKETLRGITAELKKSSLHGVFCEDVDDDFMLFLVLSDDLAMLC